MIESDHRSSRKGAANGGPESESLPRIRAPPASPTGAGAQPEGAEAALAAIAMKSRSLLRHPKHSAGKHQLQHLTNRIERFEPIIEQALDRGIKVCVVVSCVLGCPYEGEIKPA